MLPGGNEIDQASVADLRIQALDQIRALGCDTPVASANLAGAAQVTPERNQRRGRNIDRIRAERDGLDHICRIADAAPGDQRDLVADPLPAQAFIHRRQGQFNRDADIVADPGRRGAGAAAEAVDRDDVRAAARNAARNGRHIVNRRDFDDNRLFVLRRLLERIDQLTQVFNRIDVVMGCRRNRIGSFRDHARTGNGVRDLSPRQMSADAGFCALADLDLNRRAGFQVIGMHAEPAGSHLHNGIRTVLIKILVEPALAGVVVSSQFPCGPRQAFMRIVADGAVAHGGKQDGDFQLQLGREIVGPDAAVRIPLDAVRLFAEKGAGFHRFAQRIDGRIGHLGGVDQHFIPVNRIFLRVAHGGKQHAAGFRLGVDFTDIALLPVAVQAEGIRIFHDLQRMGRAERNAAMTVDAFGFVAFHRAGLRVKGMHLVCALAFAHAAGDAALRIAEHVIFRDFIVDCHYT